MTKKISVLLSVYSKDNPRFLEQALESLVNQTLKADEIVLVKDGHLSQELENVIIFFHSLLPIKEVKLEKNLGLGLALRKGLSHCLHEYVARMDADDISHSSRFEKQFSTLENNPEIDLVGSVVKEFKLKPGDLKRIKSVPEYHDEIVLYSKIRNPVNHPSVMFKKSAVISVGSYEDALFFEDYYLWMKMLKKGKIFYNIQLPLLFFRASEDMIGRRHGFNYLSLEHSFYLKLYKMDIISYFEFVKILSMRLPFRILPKKVLNIFYSKFLRK